MENRHRELSYLLHGTMQSNTVYIHTTGQETFCWVSIKRLFPPSEREVGLFKTMECELKALFLLRVIQKIVLYFLLHHLSAQWVHWSRSTTAPPCYRTPRWNLMHNFKGWCLHEPISTDTFAGGWKLFHLIKAVGYLTEASFCTKPNLRVAYLF